MRADRTEQISAQSLPNAAPAWVQVVPGAELISRVELSVTTVLGLSIKAVRSRLSECARGGMEKEAVTTQDATILHGVACRFLIPGKACIVNTDGWFVSHSRVGAQIARARAKVGTG